MFKGKMSASDILPPYKMETPGYLVEEMEFLSSSEENREIYLEILNN